MFGKVEIKTSQVELLCWGLWPAGSYPGLGLQEHMTLHILARFTVGHTSFPHGILTEIQKKRCLHTLAGLPARQLLSRGSQPG